MGMSQKKVKISVTRQLQLRNLRSGQRSVSHGTPVTHSSLPTSSYRGCLLVNVNTWRKKCTVDYSQQLLEGFEDPWFSASPLLSVAKSHRQEHRNSSQT